MDRCNDNRANREAKNVNTAFRPHDNLINDVERCRNNRIRRAICPDWRFSHLRFSQFCAAPDRLKMDRHRSFQPSLPGRSPIPIPPVEEPARGLIHYSIITFFCDPVTFLLPSNNDAEGMVFFSLH